MTASRKVLAVDDEERWLDIYATVISHESAGSIEVITAASLEAASEALGRCEELDVIILDGCVGSGFDAPEFIREVREQGSRFKGIIIAASGSPELRQLMVEVYGCEHEAPKPLVPQKVLDLLWDRQLQQQ